jgi:hypothetical protein
MKRQLGQLLLLLRVLDQPLCDFLGMSSGQEGPWAWLISGTFGSDVKIPV